MRCGDGAGIMGWEACGGRMGVMLELGSQRDCGRDMGREQQRLGRVTLCPGAHHSVGDDGLGNSASYP